MDTAIDAMADHLRTGSANQHGTFEAEFHQAITNLATILDEVGSSLARVCRTSVQFIDEGDLDAMNRIYSGRFPEPYPARTSYGVAFLGKGATVQVDAVARLG